MFRPVSLSIIRSFSLYTQQWYMSYGFADSLRAESGRNSIRSFLGLRVRIPRGTMLCTCCECCVLSGREVSRVGLITRPEKSYWEWCALTECDREAWTMGRLWTSLGAIRRGGGFVLIVSKYLITALANRRMQSSWRGSLSLEQVVRVWARKRSNSEFSSFHMSSLLVEILTLFIADNIPR